MPKDSAARAEPDDLDRGGDRRRARCRSAALWAFDARRPLARPLRLRSSSCATGLARLARRATSRGAADRNLRTAEGRLQAAAEALPDGLVVFDRNDRIAFYNSRYPGADDRGAARGPGDRQALRRLDARGHGARPGLPPRHGRGLLRAARWRMRPRRAASTPTASPTAAGCASARTGREDGGRVHAHHRHHRGAPARRPSCACWRWRWSRPATRWRSPAPTTASPTSTTPSRPRPATARPRRSAASRRTSSRAGCSRRSSSPRCAASWRPGRRWQGTIVNRHRDGHLIEQETTIAPLRDESGRTTHYVAVKRDVTEARAQARALAASEARYRAVVDAQTEFIVRVGPDGYWTFMNEAAERYVGMTLEEMRAQRHPRLRPDPAGGPADLRRAHGADHPGESDQLGRVARPAPGRQAALGALDRHRHLRRRGPARRDPVHRPRDHRPQAGRGRARGGRAAAARGAGGGARLLHRHRRPRPDHRVQRRRRAHLRLLPRARRSASR